MNDALCNIKMKPFTSSDGPASPQFSGGNYCLLGKTVNLKSVVFQDVTALINPLKLKLGKIIFKHSVRTAKKTQHFTITKTDWLMLFKEIIAVCSENHTKPTNTLCGHNLELVTGKDC
jgi:hypothetical protein